MGSTSTPNVIRAIDYRRIGKYRLLFSYLIAVVAIMRAPALSEMFFPALLILAVGVAIRIWSAGHIVKHQKLATDGPYAFTRNPLYLGTLLSFVGMLILITDPLLLVIYFVGFAIFYGATILAEQDDLQRRFGDEFTEFRKRVPVLFPRLTPAPGSKDSTFSWISLMRNNEHHTVAWSVLALILVFVRGYLR